MILRNDDLQTRLELAIERSLSDFGHQVTLLREKLGNPQDQIVSRRQKLDYLKLRTEKIVVHSLERKQSRLGRLASVLDSLSPLKVVERGYSIVMKNNEVVKSASQVSVGDPLKIRLAQGELSVKVETVKEA